MLEAWGSRSLWVQGSSRFRILGLVISASLDIFGLLLEFRDQDFGVLGLRNTSTGFGVFTMQRL